MIRTHIITLKDGFSLLQISPRLALMYKALKHPGKNGRRDRIQCAYFGFDSEQSAQEFVTWLRSHYSGIRCLARESDRLPECAFEVKVWEFDGLLALVSICTNRQVSQAA
ncbi:hypothetical protein BST81_03415 [Leptolyngbya sp. 'hensonii']|uniref:hypothetical protein n=1 Tax=Leptolyngbya sp. 'hensonii' TaxID=1922337 RepID=UPI000950227F|nr:hypothetical protein [Leptolyngbya sp. 'hensonii']OLP19835.1 hypothetical protein BST81_03415 [Leptolyngbya sp. 'hensonii']